MSTPLKSVLLHPDVVQAKQATDASANAVNCRRPCRWCLHDSNLSRRNHITSQTRAAACFTGTWTQWLYGDGDGRLDSPLPQLGSRVVGHAEKTPSGWLKSRSNQSFSSCCICQLANTCDTNIDSIVTRAPFDAKENV